MWISWNEPFRVQDQGQIMEDEQVYEQDGQVYEQDGQIYKELNESDRD